ncbi:MAG: dihydroorotate dehydrogenase electron transfer subunit [Coriobacteriales bacterium]
MTPDPQAARTSLERMRVVKNVQLTEGVGLVVFDAPRIARQVRPGQFIHLRIARDAAFILRRPFSVHRVRGELIEIVYQVLGVGTRALSLAAPGEVMDAIGPLGTGWDVPDDVTHALLVAGGLGAAPLGMLAEELSAHGVAVSVALGAPTGERLVGRELFESVARRVVLCTDDGTVGRAGFVTAVVDALLVADRPDIVCACGPEAMARTVCEKASAAGVPCRVSLERLMACGVGACLSCVVSTRTGQKRACIDGPVFWADDVVWESVDASCWRGQG